MPDSDIPHASAPFDVMTILATMLSGSLIPSLIARLVGSVTSSVEAWGLGAGCAKGATLKALYKVAPSGAKALPPTFCSALKFTLKTKGALAFEYAPSTCSVLMSYSEEPAIKREPSGAMDKIVEEPATVRL